MLIVAVGYPDGTVIPYEKKDEVVISRPDGTENLTGKVVGILDVDEGGVQVGTEFTAEVKVVTPNP